MKKVSKIISVILALCLVLQMGAICVLAEDGDSTASTPVDTQIIAPLTSFAYGYTNGLYLGRPTGASYGGFKALTNYMSRAEVFGVFGKDQTDSVLKTTSTTNTPSDRFLIDIDTIKNIPINSGDYVLFSTQVAFDKDVASLYLGVEAKNTSGGLLWFGLDKPVSLSRFGTAGDVNLNVGQFGNSMLFGGALSSSLYLEAGKWYDFDVLITRNGDTSSTMKVYLDNVLLAENTQNAPIGSITKFQFCARNGIQDITDSTISRIADVETYLDNISMTQYSGYTEVPAAVAALGTTALSAKSGTNLKQQYNTFYAVADMTVSDVLNAINVPAGVNAVYTDKNFSEITETTAAAANGYIKATDASGNVTYYSMLTDLVLAYDDFSDSRFAPRLSKYITAYKQSGGHTGGNYETEYVGGIGGKAADDYALKYYSAQPNTAKYDFWQVNNGYGWDAYDTMPLVREMDVMFTGDNDQIEIISREAGITFVANASSLSKNEWHRLTVAYFGNTGYLWVDGKYNTSVNDNGTTSKSSKFQTTLGVFGATEAVETAIYVDDVKLYYADSADFFANGAAKETIADYISAESLSENITISSGSVLLKNHMAYADFIAAIELSSNVTDTKVYADSTYTTVVTDGTTADGNVLVLTTASGAKEYYGISIEKTEGSIAFTTSVDEENPSITYLTATATVTTNKDEAPYILILAEFIGDNFNDIVDMKPGDATENGTQSITVTYDSAKTYKAFIFDSIANIKPLGGCAEYNVAQ